ncbi:MAG: ABC-type multidrug transport system ATPase subunit [Flammeovirgaceae bacterium]|jgi:ABC-type multidrug transport system ATPase subunit
MNGLQADSISKLYEGKAILTDVFVYCQVGEIVGLLGRNGSGKSTMLKVIFGSIPAEHRFVKIDGIVNGSMFENRNLISYLPQDSFLPSNLKVKKAISLFCNSSAVAEKLKSEPILKSILETKCGDISGGESRALEILLILNSKAKYILMDEPFNGIAPIYKEQVKEWIWEKSSQKGFIITDHDYENILSVSTRLMLMYDGGTKQIESRSELVEWGYLRAE